MMSVAAAESAKEGPELKRKLSKREKKELKKQEKLNKANKGKDAGSGNYDSGVAEKLYTGSFFSSKLVWLDRLKIKSSYCKTMQCAS